MAEIDEVTILEIIISPDYTVGLWTVDSKGDTMATNLDDDDLPFAAPKELQERFDQWVDDYFSTLNEHKLFDWDEYDARGRQLAQEIKNLAGKDLPVTFRPCRETIDTFVGLPDEVIDVSDPDSSA